MDIKKFNNELTRLIDSEASYRTRAIEHFITLVIIKFNAHGDLFNMDWPDVEQYDWESISYAPFRANIEQMNIYKSNGKGGLDLIESWDDMPKKQVDEQ